MDQSNYAIIGQINDHLHSLHEKLDDPHTQEKAGYWQPKALIIQQKAKIVTDFIDSLKRELKIAADLKLIDGKEIYKEDDFSAVINLFFNKKAGEQLKLKLISFRQEMLNLDLGIAKEFTSSIDITLKLSNKYNDESKAFNDTFFKDIPSIACIAVLSQFQNNIKIIEAQLVTFCDYKIPEIDQGFIKI